MKEFKEVVKLKKVPATFVFRCGLCGVEITDFDWHMGLIKINDHLTSKHAHEAKSLDSEELYSRKSTISLESF